MYFKNISFTEEPGQYRFRFLNGEILLPNEPGGYVMATGCGAGKTTAIRQLMLTKFHEGILYSAATIKECNEMYDYLVFECTNNVIEVISPSGDVFRLTPDKILTIHSEPRLEEINGRIVCTNGVNTSLWENHPEKVADFYIVICTHHKLLHESPDVLMKSNFTTILSSIDLITRAMKRTQELNSKISYPRQWMLIDELPTCDPLIEELDKLIISSLNDSVTNERILGFDDYGQKISEYFLTSVAPKDFNLLKFKLLTALGSVTSSNLSRINLNKPVDKLKFELISSLIFHEIQKYNRSTERSIKIIYNLSKLVLESGIDTKMILFDGTGDLTQLGGSRFKVLTYPNKYNSPINVFRFESHLDRTVKIDKTFSRRENIMEGLNKNIAELQNIINQNQKTLIVTWKNLKDESLKITKSMLGNPELTNNSNIAKFVMNDEFSLTEYYKNRLIAKDGKEFSIIHYQSGLDKATNEFRDYDSVVFLGKFQVPNSAIKDFNELYGCNTDLGNFTTYQLVQAVCRTRIRKHRGEPINIYFSNDWNNKIIDSLISYISHDKINSPIITDTSLDFIKPKWRTAVDKLRIRYPEFKEAIERKLNLTISIGLNDIYEVIPMSEKKVKYYYPLINYLRKLGIDLIVISPKSK